MKWKKINLRNLFDELVTARNSQQEYITGYLEKDEVVNSVYCEDVYGNRIEDVTHYIEITEYEPQD